MQFAVLVASAGACCEGQQPFVTGNSHHCNLIHHKLAASKQQQLSAAEQSAMLML
jgi:hypothetical protein